MKINFLEATRILKNDLETKGCPIIMLSSKFKDREKGLEADSDDYFAKTFSPLELRREVEDMIGS